MPELSPGALVLPETAECAAASSCAWVTSCCSGETGMYWICMEERTGESGRGRVPPGVLLWPQLLQQITNPHVPSISHPSLPPSPPICSEPVSWQSRQLQPLCLAPYLRLLEELAALLILDVGDLTILNLGTRAAVRLCQG